MMPFGLSALIVAAEISWRTICEYTWHSRTRRAMTCVYCDPKSRMTTRETEPAAMLVADAGLFADDGIFRAIRLDERALAGDAALQLFRAIGIRGTRRHITFATS